MNLKIKIKDSEHSKKVQLKLFELGYRWRYSALDIGKPNAGMDLVDKEYKYIFVDDGIISASNRDYVFEEEVNKEVTFNDLDRL